MKKYLFLIIYGFLLPAPASAQQSAEQRAQVDKGIAITQRSGRLLNEAVSRAMEQCNTTRLVVPRPRFDFGTNTETTVDTTVALEWTGACVDGKRDGNGVLTWIEETTYQTSSRELRSIVTQKAEGRFVKGLRLGLWCMTHQIISNGKPVSQLSGCQVLTGSHLDVNLYSKQLDGSWKASYGDTTLAAGALEAQSAKVLADAAAGKTDFKVELVGQNQLLDDLVSGSKIVLDLRSVPISLKDKRVAILLSSRTISELERFKREREALISASGGLTGDAANYRAAFIAASSPDRPLTNVIKTVRKYVGAVFPVDDLVRLQKGEFDYALIIDWRHMTRFDLLGKYDNSYPNKEEKPEPACESWAAFLVTSDLKAVKQLNPSPRCYPKGKDYNGDFHYMVMLSGYFQNEWGKTPDDPGTSMIGLDYLLK